MPKHKFIPRKSYLKTLPGKRISAGAFLQNQKGEYLLVKPSYKDHWSIPGGVVDPKESPLEGCLREVEEEIGLKLINLTLAGCVYVKDDRFDDESIQFFFYGGKLSQKEVKSIKIDGDEIVDFKFVNIKNLAKYSKSIHKRIKILLHSRGTNSLHYLEEHI